MTKLVLELDLVTEADVEGVKDVLKTTIQGMNCSDYRGFGWVPPVKSYQFARTTEGATQTDRVDEQHNDGRVVAGEAKLYCENCGHVWTQGRDFAIPARCHKCGAASPRQCLR